MPKSAARKTTARKTTAKKTAAKKTTAKKTAAKKTTAKKASAKTTAQKATAKAAPATADLTHCYRLIFQVSPGGSRKAESYVAGTFAEAQKAALADLGSGDGAYHALYYGEQILLQCWEGAKKRTTIDLHPYIEYRVPGIPRVLRFRGDGDHALLDMDDEDDSTMMAMIEGELDITVKVDWTRVESRLPALAGRPLRKGESMTLEDGRAWQHGFHEHWDSMIDD